MDDQIYEIVAKTLNGESTGEEKARLQSWLNADPLNKKEYEEIKMLWQDAEEVLTKPEFDATVAWEKVNRQIGYSAIEESHKRKGKTINLSVTIKLLAAAAVLVLGIFLLRPFMEDGLKEVVAVHGNESITLPDNSHVLLRKGSTLKYPAEFKGGKRQIALKGEAFFDVTRNEQQPFIIDAEAVEVKVLGTSFNVNCGQKKAIVTVASGKVQVSKGRDKVILEKGQEGIYTAGKLVKGNAVSNGYMYWQTGTVKYDLVPFASVISDLSKILAINIKIDESVAVDLQEKPIAIEFKKSTIKQILDDVCLITGCKWSYINNEYIISKP